MIYVMSDIHGRLDRFEKMLKLINLNDEDELYILGDVIDRGPASIRILQKIMMMPNVTFLVGNHEHMMLECAQFLMTEITEESINMLDSAKMAAVLDWFHNGGDITMKEFRHLPAAECKEILDYIQEGLILKNCLLMEQNFSLFMQDWGISVRRRKLTIIRWKNCSGPELRMTGSIFRIAM